MLIVILTISCLETQAQISWLQVDFPDCGVIYYIHSTSNEYIFISTNGTSSADICGQFRFVKWLKNCSFRKYISWHIF